MIQNLGTIISIILGVITIITGTAIPVYKIAKKKFLKEKERIAIIDAIPQQLLEVTNQLENIENKVDTLYNKYDVLETQELKHIINDAVIGTGALEEVPDELLINASQSCEIYLGKGLNHETGAKCKLIYEEIERRQRLRSNKR